jgi:CelD/BcsL family acetyltransferase involved in cellulose biosynthesis
MPSGTDRWSFEWRRSWADVWSDEFMREWHCMMAQPSHAHVYHRPELVRRWVETDGAQSAAAPHFGIATSPSGAKVFLPWIVAPHHGRLISRRTLEPAGRELFGYHSPLVTGAEPSSIDWPHFWESARTAVGGACDQALFRLVEPEFSAGSALHKPSEDSPVLSLEGCASLDDVLARCASSHRVDVKRQRRRASERGEVTLSVATRADAADARRGFREELWPAYRAAWEGRSISSTLLRDGVEGFLALVAGAGVDEGWGHYSALRIGGVPVAWHLGLLDSGRLYYWVPTHDARWANYSPGKLLLAELIEYGCREGWREIHLLTGNHDYKRAWNPTPRRLAAIAWTAPTTRGRAIGWYDARAHVRS